MSISRRRLAAQLFGAGAVALIGGRAAAQSATQYAYDVFGRLTQVTYPNGQRVIYSYDSANNRTQMLVSYLIPITGSSPVNLRTLANSAGYTGASNAILVFEVGNGVYIGGVAGGYGTAGMAVDTGTWPSGVNITLTVKNGGGLHGGGGRGGIGGGAGYAGGDGVYCQTPMTINIESGGVIRGGGGGGGGQARDAVVFGFCNWYLYAANGGGGGSWNGAGGAGEHEWYGCDYIVSYGANGDPGAWYGAGGAPNGGALGQPGGTGAGGALGSPGLAGGAAGYAIRKNGHAVTVNNAGTTAGTIG